MRIKNYQLAMFASKFLILTRSTLTIIALLLHLQILKRRKYTQLVVFALELLGLLIIILVIATVLNMKKSFQMCMSTVYPGYAEDALKFLNTNPDAIKQFKLVQPGPHQTSMIARGPIVHFNFKAKPRDDPDAPIETFFPQLRMHPSTVVDCCVSLGSKVSDWRSANTRRCKYCVGEVHHPGPAIPCPKLIKGLPKDGDWLYGPDSDDE